MITTTIIMLINCQAFETLRQQIQTQQLVETQEEDFCHHIGIKRLMPLRIMNTWVICQLVYLIIPI